MVREESGGKLESVLLSGAVCKIFKITTTVHRRIVVNGKEFQSVDDMPAEVRAAYKRALADASGRVTAAGAPIGSPLPAFRPPPSLDEDDRRGGLRRIATWVAIGLLLVLWLFWKSTLGH
jgi:hypothetical protein